MQIKCQRASFIPYFSSSLSPVFFHNISMSLQSSHILFLHMHGHHMFPVSTAPPHVCCLQQNTAINTETSLKVIGYPGLGRSLIVCFSCLLNACIFMCIYTHSIVIIAMCLFVCLSIIYWSLKYIDDCIRNVSSFALNYAEILII